MQELTSFITEVFFSVPEMWRYVIIFGSSFIEGMPILGSVMPGGTVALLVGSLSAKAFINPSFAVVLIAVGTFTGDMAGFMIGRYYRNTPWLKRLVSHEGHQKSWDLFDRHIALVVIFGKLLPLVRSLPSLFAAVRGILIRKYVAYSAIGSILWAFVGIYGGNVLARVLGDYAVVIILGLLVVSGLVVIFKRKK